MLKRQRFLSPIRDTSTIVAAAIFLALYGLLIVISPIAGSSFLVNNFIVLISPLAIAAVGTTLVLIMGGFDLSVAGTISVANVVAATAMTKNPDSAWLIALAVIVMGAVVGLLNGFLISVIGLSSLGVTLATNIVLTGIALVIMPAPGGLVPPDFASTLTGMAGPIPFSALVLVALCIAWVIFTKTRTGMAVFAIGGDINASRLSGIPVKRVQMSAYSIAGGLYAVAGLYLSALTATGSPSAGSSFLLTAFTAAALGLVSFRGGRGSAIAAIFGAGTVMVIPKFLFAAGIADFWVGAFQGLIVLIALTIPTIAARIAAAKVARRNKPRPVLTTAI
jgi:ribose transport system permease protein